MGKVEADVDGAIGEENDAAIANVVEVAVAPAKLKPSTSDWVDCASSFSASSLIWQDLEFQSNGDEMEKPSKTSSPYPSFKISASTSQTTLQQCSSNTVPLAIGLNPDFTISQTQFPINHSTLGRPPVATLLRSSNGAKDAVQLHAATDSVYERPITIPGTSGKQTGIEGPPQVANTWEEGGQEEGRRGS